MTAPRILSFLSVLVALLGIAAPPASAGGVQFTLTNSLPKEMVFEFTFLNLDLGREETEYYTVPPGQTVQFVNDCGPGICADGEFGILGPYKYEKPTFCTVELNEYFGTGRSHLTVTLTERDSPPWATYYWCSFTGSAIVGPHTDLGNYRNW